CLGGVWVWGATEIVTRPPLDLRRRQQLLRFDDGTLAVDPLRLDRIEPGTLARQSAHQDAHPAFPLDPAVVLLDPAPHPRADVPGSNVPNQQPRLLALPGPFAADPRTEGPDDVE